MWVRRVAWSKCPLGSGPARLLRLLRARLAALGGSALPGAEARPLGAQPLPRVLELAVSKVADCTAFDHIGGAAHAAALQRGRGATSRLAAPELRQTAGLRHIGLQPFDTWGYSLCYIGSQAPPHGVTASVTSGHHPAAGLRHVLCEGVGSAHWRRQQRDSGHLSGGGGGALPEQRRGRCAAAQHGQTETAFLPVRRDRPLRLLGARLAAPCSSALPG